MSVKWNVPSNSLERINMITCQRKIKRKFEQREEEKNRKKMGKKIDFLPYWKIMHGLGFCLATALWSTNIKGSMIAMDNIGYNTTNFLCSMKRTCNGQLRRSILINGYVIDQCKQEANKAEKSALPNFGRQKGRLGSVWR